MLGFIDYAILGVGCLIAAFLLFFMIKEAIKK